MKKAGFVLFCLFIISAFAAQANAEIQIFTDRNLWQQAGANTITTENVNCEPASYDELTLPYTTQNGITLNWINHQYGVIQMLPNNYIDGTTGPLFRDFGDQLSFALPKYIQGNAIGFDYFYNGSSVEVWEMQVNW